ncbi:hypothetical protein PVAP13_7KG375501 [Panicum virgatum]|uniref:Uncharacterized protein n=1 Tax=Panicum virgatum TaxID=38727 RepID=A0A8T0QRF3_PANVG|nr:hypothetical protein PVAP13_7KG375501 [Panicum virgatum]
MADVRLLRSIGESAVAAGPTTAGLARLCATPAPTSRAPPPHHLPYSHAAAGQPPREAGAGALPAPSLLPASAHSRPASRAETASHRGPPPTARPPPSAGSHAGLPRGEAAARAEVVTVLLLLLLPLLALAARADDDGGGDSEAAAVLPAEAGARVWRAHPAPAATGCSRPGVHSCALASEVATSTDAPPVWEPRATPPPFASSSSGGTRAAAAVLAPPC